jgi:hypothetical protein
MAHIIKPPTPISLRPGHRSVFLAGSIEMGQAEAWQAEFERAFAEDDFTILNPRRDEWEASWVQSIHNPNFREQVEWELAGQERADVIAMYFHPQTKAPITLLELGLCARSGKAIVCCPEGFWRRGNIEVVCAQYSVTMVESMAELIEKVRQMLGLKSYQSAG